MPNPKEIAVKKFEKALGFGYRMDDVEEYLGLVAREMEDLIEEKEDLEKKLMVLADKLNEYREDEESLRTAILSAQKLGDSLIRESKNKADIIMRDATIKADTLVGNARRQIERENETLIRIQKEVALFKTKLIELYKQHIELITSLPGDDDKPANKSSAPKKAEEKPAAAPAAEEVDSNEEATIEFSPAEEIKAPEIMSEASLTPDEEKALKGEEQSALPFQEEETKRLSMEDSEEDAKLNSLKNSFGEGELDDDELDLAFFNKAKSNSHESKKKEMRFGESFKFRL